MNWSPQQDAALLAVKRWLAEPAGSRKPFFYLAGVAGSGKSSLARCFADDFDGKVAYGAYTGKAAKVMREKGCADATTIHKMIYSPRLRSQTKLRALHDSLARAKATVPPDPHLVAQVQRDVDDEERAHRAIGFEFVGGIDADLIVIDEVSMCGTTLGEDLLSLRVPILVLGDPAQLPPVGDGGFFTNGEPDFFLSEVHRQAKDSPVLRMATIVREGGEIALGQYGNDSFVVDRAPPPEEVLAFSQIICGTNARRRAVNARVRELLGRTSRLPEEDDRLICLRNDHRVGVLNGEMWWVDAAAEHGRLVSLALRDDEVKPNLDADVDPDSVGSDSASLTVEAHVEPFLGKEVSALHKMDALEFDYGYCCTCHKMQGTGAPSVLIFDESRVFRQDARRWLYTAITRASERVTVVRS